MKKTGKYIVIMLVVLAVLGGATALLMNLPQEKDQEESSMVSSEAAESLPLFEKEMAEVSSVQVENSEGGFTLVPAAGSGTDEAAFTLEGYEDRDLDASLITSNVRTLMALNASKDLGSRDNLEDFGLGKDAAVVTIRYTDGGSDKITVGNNAGESVGKYVLKDGSVYIASGVPVNFAESKFSYFNTEIYTIADRTQVTEDEEGSAQESAALDIMYSLTLSGAAFPEPVTIEYTSKATSGYLITSPITAESGNTPFEEMMAALKSLTASSVVEAGLTDEVLEQYGLLEPEVKIGFNLNDSEHVLAVSAKDSDGNRYLTADDKDLVYQVTDESVSTWADSSLSKLRMSYIWIPNIKNVEKLTVTLEGDQVHEYNVTRTKNEEKSTETNVQYDLSIVNAGGEEVNYDDGYQPFYQKLISLAVFSQEEADFSGTPDVKVQYEYFEGGGDTLELYKMKDQNRYVVVLNGGFNGQIRGTEVSAVLELIP